MQNKKIKMEKVETCIPYLLHPVGLPLLILCDIGAAFGRCGGQITASDLCKRILKSECGQRSPLVSRARPAACQKKNTTVNWDDFLNRPSICNHFSRIIIFSTVTRHWLYFVLQANLALREGSGYFFVNTSVKGIVDVVFQEAQGTVQVRRNIWTVMGLVQGNTQLWYWTTYFVISKKSILLRSEILTIETSLWFACVICVCPGFSRLPRGGEGDRSWPLFGIPSTCQGHSTRFWHPGGLCESGWQGQCPALESLTSEGPDTAWLDDPYYQYHTFPKCLSDV